MSTYLGKNCPFDLRCVTFVYVYQFVCVRLPLLVLWMVYGIRLYKSLGTAFLCFINLCHSFPFGFESGMWNCVSS